MANHTPGPWRFNGSYLLQDCPARDGDGREGNPFCTPAERPILSANGEDLVVWQPSDARLIAAAPDMLAALKAALPWVAIAIAGDVAFGTGNPQRTKNHAEDIALIQAAIAKAEGSTHG